MEQNKIINRYISYLLLLAVYSAFFTVQLTSNFDIRGSAPLFAAKSFKQNLQQNNFQTLVKATHNASPKKANVRLNKRFHPEFAPSCLVSLTEAPVGYFQKKVIGSRTNPFISTAFLFSHLQRGPPVVA